MNYAVLYGKTIVNWSKFNELNSYDFSAKTILCGDKNSLESAYLNNSVDAFISNTCDIGVEEAIKTVVSFGWKAFRLGNLDIVCEGAKGKFFVIYKGEASKIFDDYIFSKEFTIEETFEYIALKIEKIESDDLRAKLKKIFAKIGIYSNLLGYEYLISGVIEVVRDKKLINSLTTELYPKLAKTFSTGEKNIERNMRNAIEVSFNRGKFFEIANSLGGNFTSYEKPSNGEFIAFLADMIAE